MEVYMFFKNNRQPSFAHATAGVGSSAPKQTFDGMTFDAGSSDTDDFGTYNQAPKRAPRPQKQSQPKKKRSFNLRGLKLGNGFKFKRTSIIVALIAVVAVIVLLSLIIAFISSSGKDIKYENNAYVSYCDDAGIYRVMYNGKIIGEYDNEIELITADDRSFAYIIENGTEGYKVHVAEGKKIETITSSPVTKVLATAGLSPAVVWLELDAGIYLYTEEHGEERITRDHSTLKEDSSKEGQYNYIFHISADGSAVTYAQTDPDTGDFYLYVYKDSLPIKSTKYLIPVAISDDGEFVFGYGISSKDGVTKAFYVVSGEDRYLIDEGFDAVIDINTEGNEIVYTTNTESGVATYIYSFKPKKLDDDKEPTKVGSGVCVPISADPEIARFSTFKNCYFERIDGDEETSTPTYFVNKKYESTSICSFRGKFSTDGDYFYYINKSDTLQRIELKDDSHTPEKIAEDIVAFEVTQKGNVYWLNDSGRLSFYDTSKSKTTRIADDAASITMHDYSNTLYYTSSESIGIYTTKEGSGKESAELDSNAIVSLPSFTTPEFKKCYAAVWDADNLNFNVYYTSNGRSFKHVAVCVDVSGLDISDILDDIVSGGDIRDDEESGIG